MLWIGSRSRGVFLLLTTSLDQLPILDLRSGSHQRHEVTVGAMTLRRVV